jgi:hypothetical protein
MVSIRENGMSGEEKTTQQSFQSSPAGAERDGQPGGTSTIPRFSDVAEDLVTLAETGGQGASPKASITDQSLRDLSRYLMEHDPSSQLFVPLAEEFCARRLWQDAVDTCRRGLAFHPRQFRIRVLLGWALWELSHHEEAETLLGEARKELEKSAEIYRILARAAEGRGESAKAWRLMHAYEILRQSDSRQTAKQVDTPTAQPSEPTPGQEPLLVSFLTSLLNNYETVQTNAVPTMQIFSDADRLLLANILRMRKP